MWSREMARPVLVLSFVAAAMLLWISSPHWQASWRQVGTRTRARGRGRVRGEYTVTTTAAVGRRQTSPVPRSSSESPSRGGDLSTVSRQNGRGIFDWTGTPTTQRPVPARGGSCSAPFTRGPGRQALLSVGSFTGEQLTMGCLQFSTLISTALAWRRDVVMPTILGRFFVGMAGFRYVDDQFLLRRVREANSTSPLPLDHYYKLDRFRSLLQSRNLTLVTEGQARSSCTGQWTVLVLDTTWPHPPQLCYGNSSLRRRANDLFARLRDSTAPKLSLDRDCRWLLDCMPASIRRLRPFCGVTCASVPSRHAMQWSAGDVAAQVDALSSRCLLLVHWFGARRHGIRLPYLPVAWFRVSDRILAAARAAISRSPLGGRFGAVHVRMEFLLRWCVPGGLASRPVTSEVRTCVSGCFAKLSSKVKLRAGNESMPLLLAFDEASASFGPAKTKLMQPHHYRTWLRNELNLTFTRILYMDDLFRTASLGAEQLTMLRNHGLRSLLEAQILASATIFLAMGGGNFQKRIRKLRDNRDDETVCRG